MRRGTVGSLPTASARSTCLQEANRRIFPKPGAQRPDAPGWSSLLTERVVGKVLVNQPVPDEVFEADFLEGTLVSDSVNRSTYKVGDRPGPDPEALTKVGDA